MEGPGSAQDVTREDVRGVFAASDRPSAPLTTTEVADRLDCATRAARRPLEELVDRDELRTRELETATRVWWRPEGAADQQADDAAFGTFASPVAEYGIFALDPDGTVATWNEGAKRITGYEADEIVGEPFATLSPEADVAERGPERLLETAAAEGRVEDEGPRVRDDGTRTRVRVTVTAVRDDDGALRGFTAVMRETTDERTPERRLQRERDFTEQILETVPVGIGLLTTAGDVVRANGRLIDRFGIGDPDADGSSIDSRTLYDADGEPIPPDERPWTRVLETGDPTYEYECRVDGPDGDGGRRWLSITAVPLEREGDDEPKIVLAVDDVTERKERERRLRREYEQTEKLLRTAPVAIAVQNTERETVMANRRAQEAFGLSESEFTDDPVDAGEWEIYDADGDPLAPEETTSARVLRTGEPVFDEELIFEPPNGERLYFRVNTAPIFGPDGEIDRVITGGKDITELKRRERQLERRKSELETELSEIFGRISDAFYAIDDEFRFTHLNDRAADLVDRPRDEILGRKVWDVVPDGTEERHREQFERALETQEPVTFEMYVEEFDIWFEFNVYPSETGLSVYFRDVSERKEYQRKLEESNERLQQFAYAASHDLQEPLRMVTSYLQLLERRYADELDSDAEEFIAFAVDGAERMRRMIDGLLEYSRVETQGDPLEPIDLDEALDDAIGNLEVKIEESDADIEAGPLPRVRGDESQLQQVFQNLLSNAIEYSGDEPPRIRISADRRGSKWEITVSDDGIGIDPDDQERIFEVFQRLHGRGEHPGTGIGLSLCQRIVERHGGEMGVDSEPGEGTAFTFTLPAA